MLKNKIEKNIIMNSHFLIANIIIENIKIDLTSKVYIYSNKKKQFSFTSSLIHKWSTKQKPSKTK